MQTKPIRLCEQKALEQLLQHIETKPTVPLSDFLRGQLRTFLRDVRPGRLRVVEGKD